MSVLRLARFELRRLTRGRLPRAALAVLTVIPLLYGALYLYAFWDPYGKLDRIPVALVNADRPATAADGSPVRAGQDLTDELLDRRVFGWHVTDPRDAAAGLRSGRYHLIFSIPADFSATLAAGPEPDRPARRGELKLVNDDATNYLSGLLARSAFGEIRAAAAESAAKDYFARMLVGFTDARAETARAADGAGQLADGLGRSEAGAGTIADGLGTSGAGADQLADGLGGAAAGAQTLAGGLDRSVRGVDELAAGLGELRAGAGQLADGTARAATETRAVADRVNGAAERIEPVLRDNAGRIEQAATAIAEGAQALADGLDALPRRAEDAVSRAEEVRDRLAALVAEHPELADDRSVVAARAAATAAVEAARAVTTTLDGAELTALRDRMTGVAATAREIAAAAPHLADDVATARAKVNELATGLGTLARGSAELRDGLGTAAGGADELRGGLFRLATGARELDGGLTRLGDGSERLADGLTRLESGAGDLAAGLTRLGGGAGDLADGLTAGADRLPGYDDAEARADVLGDPVALERSTRNPAGAYGVGFAPYFLGLALWVGAMITYLLLRPLNRRHVMSGAPAWRVALAGWLPAAAIGLAQAGMLFAVVTLALGLDPARPAATFGLLALASLAFTAIVQWLGAQLGPAGRLAALALLMLQLTSSGGTYPVQTSPGFFQVVHPWLPMSYLVAGLRHTVNGGPVGPVLTGAAVLAGFAAGALALTVAAARRSRRLTPATLHPELTM
ncbi:YhgE/Pip domain-containing protein [Micromonospora sp. C28SCA-DRY-2]|uniref:YhgE/Pip domain-containing protein n=1 Tax=Micromonospora sp. C28SCA-DRY-2 TaxID=3059522 RepID=UPI00267487ED|nr:YhgE/Pip domain-containing protein [Micromonospora sp. C28SCA-DRY-2]MDO3700622.1 YhgE/Pip domain-containing protein [Micromonospora sp. C28SCA-DRY-2]